MATKKKTKLTTRETQLAVRLYRLCLESGQAAHFVATLAYGDGDEVDFYSKKSRALRRETKAAQKLLKTLAAESPELLDELLKTTKKHGT